jgi:hypothetical protein
LFYYKANYKHPPLQFHNRVREKDFTVYNRVHKWWRATALTHLLDAELLDNSYWSYGNIDNNDQLSDNPIEIDILGLRSKTLNFINNAPYFCDQLNTTQHNRHSLLVPEHYSNSYIHIVFETFFDADQSQGTFLSEKTFKPIKHAQPFVLVAPAGSLKLLRELGYKTFDSVIDTSYDTIENNTERWIAVYNLINSLKHSNLYDIYQKCKDDILHNQQHFMTCGYSRLYALWRNIRDV